MTIANFINWNGLRIPKISEGARIDIVAPRVPYFGHFIERDAIRVIFPPGLVALSQIVLGSHYRAYPVDAAHLVEFENFEPLVIVAHDIPEILPSHINPMPNCKCLPDEPEDYEPDIGDYYPDPEYDL